MIGWRTRHEEIHSTAFAARIEAVEALQAAGLGSEGSTARLSSAASGLRLIAESYGDAPSAGNYSAFADLIEIAALLLEWRTAVLGAAADAHRFLTAAKERAAVWSHSHLNTSIEGLRDIADVIAGIQLISEVAAVADRLAGVPLPVGLYSSPRRKDRAATDIGDAPKSPSPLIVAFLKFTVDGRPVEEVHYVSPRETHDMDIEVRVSRWPSSATELVLEPISIEPSGTYQLPTFSIPAPMGTGPFRLTKRGRATIAVPQHFGARPFEFKYVPHFVPTTSDQPVETIGQRTLLLEGIDAGLHPITGYPNLDRKLIALRDHIRATPGIGQQELADTLTLAAPLANLAGQARQDNSFGSVFSEPEFQVRIRQTLRGWPTIGAELDEHPHAAGGITDLSFRGVRLELKVEDTRSITLRDCDSYLGQTVSYIAANGKRLGILCVLDCSEKKRPAFPAEDGIGVLVHNLSETPIIVITILIQGNLARPSSFSR